MAVVLSGCGTLFSQFKEYCEDRVDCADGNSDDEDAELLTRSVDKQIQRTLDMIKRGDPAIYDAGTQLYNSDETSDSDDDSSSGDSSSSDDDSWRVS